ncbi:MAG: hypothetical protein R3348_10035, partial [Xanthomonadales bacterium]|nr:hypothetical protein [Xanthomonadales bacterium]
TGVLRPIDVKINEQVANYLLFPGPIRSRVGPFRNLERQQYADDDNQEVDPYREPVLLFAMFGDAAKYHRLGALLSS